MHNPEDIASHLLSWYHTHKRAMPWRTTVDPYKIWLSEVMLQQTQVATVIPYYTRFISRYPTLESLFHAHDDDVLKLWEGLGYYRRCHHFLKAVRQVMTHHHGKIPHDPKEFSSLAGVGDYTTAAVMSIAFGQGLAVVDGNVIRVMSRYHCIEGDTTKAATRNIIKQKMETHLPQDQPGDFNQAVMELGATVCLPKNPLCADCPIEKKCCAAHLNRIDDFPLIPKKKKIPVYDVGLAVIVMHGTCLIQKRKTKGHLAGMWELPGGKVRSGETVNDAIKRKCLDELGVAVTIKEQIAQASHVYSHFKINVSVYVCSINGGEAKGRKNQDIKWVTYDDLDLYAFPAANHKFFKKIRGVFM